MIVWKDSRHMKKQLIAKFKEKFEEGSTYIQN